MATSGDEERVVTVNIYDTHASNANFKVKPTTTAAEICKIILSKRDILSSESRFFSIVVVVTAFNATKKVETHCLRTLKPNETLIEVQQTIVLKMMEKCCIPDQSKVDNTAKWYFKDMRTNPIELGATSEICGEYDSDEDEIISPSDLSYLAKSERKGYLLKRSNTDFNLWKRWYCVLMDQLWCVDIAKEIPCAKCVHLSGMIRYREGYKTLDQLQIIIINSSDGKSHFFRAFNLIDQKKWIQDLNIKTRIGAENNSFAMAEMMITDESNARTCRLTKQVGKVLDRTKAMEAIALHKAVELEHNSSSNGGGNSSGSSHSNSSYHEHRHIQESKLHGEVSSTTDTTTTVPSEQQQDEVPMISRSNSMLSESTPKPNINFMFDLDEVKSPDKSTTSTTANRGANRVDKAVSKEGKHTVDTENHQQQNTTTTSTTTFIKTHGSLPECTQLTHPRSCSHLHLHTIGTCDRTEGHSLVHELHKDSKVVTDVIMFIIDIQHYRECLRRELYIPIPKQQERARQVYLKYILPQLQFANLENFPDFQNEALQLGGEVVVAVGDHSIKVLTIPSSPSRLSNLTSTTTTGSTSKGVFSPAVSNKQSLRSEYATRVRNRSFTSQRGNTDPMSPGGVAAGPDIGSSASAVLDWGIEVSILMRVHEALFSMHQKAIELQNGYVTQDPLQLIKYAAGTSKFKARDRSISTATTSSATITTTSSTVPGIINLLGSPSAAPAIQPSTPTPAAASSSFWPWFSTSFSSIPASTASTANSASNSACSSPVPTARKGTTEAALTETPTTTTTVTETQGTGEGSLTDSAVSVDPSVGIADRLEETRNDANEATMTITKPIPTLTPLTPPSTVPIAAVATSTTESNELKPPSAELFDEVVHALLQKLS